MRLGDMDDMKDYELVYGAESADFHGNKTGVKIFVLRTPETREAQKNLDNDHKKWGGKLTPFEEENHWYSRAGKEVERLLDLQAARLDPKTQEHIDKTKGEFAQAFKDAGLGPIFMEAIENKYWPKAYAADILRDPWYLVTTPIGVIEIGWRKRVINIDWSRTILQSLLFERESAQPRGDELFPTIVADGETTTLGDTYVHAYGYEKATKYLKVMAEWNLKVLETRAKEKREAKEPLKWSDPK